MDKLNTHPKQDLLVLRARQIIYPNSGGQSHSEPYEVSRIAIIKYSFIKNMYWVFPGNFLSRKQFTIIEPPIPQTSSYRTVSHTLCCFKGQNQAGDLGQFFAFGKKQHFFFFGFFPIHRIYSITMYCFHNMKKYFVLFYIYMCVCLPKPKTWQREIAFWVETNR